MSDEERKAIQKRAGIAGGIGGAAMGVLAGLWSSETISTSTLGALVIVPLVLFFIVGRNIILLRQRVTIASAIWRYNRDFLASTLGYVVALSLAIYLWNNVEGARQFAWALALLPIAPTFAMIFFMGRYLNEETDEFLRHRAVMSSMVGLGFVLVLGTAWGFMETFGAVPHVWAWWVVPCWAIGLGLGQAYFGMRDNREEAV